MDRKLNCDLVRQAAEKAGFTYTRLAQQVGVSTESVSKWMRGDALPRPGKALKLGRTLGLTYEQMFGVRDASTTPQVAFRLTRNQKASAAHLERAEELGRMYELLVPSLPFSAFVAPAQLKNPTTDRDYLEALCQQVRREMGIEPDAPVPLRELFAYLSEKLQAVIVPVFWSHRASDAELAAHIYSQRTRTTWIPFNLDTKVWDARFWVAHELAHAYTYDTFDNREEGEAFADAFAGTLVMPEAVARQAYEKMRASRSNQTRRQLAIAFARQMHISPICVAKQVDRYAAERNLPPVAIESQQLYGAIESLRKAEPSLANELFPLGPPNVSQLREVAATYFKTPFFDALSKYLKSSGGSPAFVQGLLDCPLADAKALNSELA